MIILGYDENNSSIYRCYDTESNKIVMRRDVSFISFENDLDDSKQNRNEERASQKPTHVSKNMQNQSNKCWDHEIQFSTNNNSVIIRIEECATMLEKANICTFLDKRGRCCKHYFRHISSLILH